MQNLFSNIKTKRTFVYLLIKKRKHQKCPSQLIYLSREPSLNEKKQKKDITKNGRIKKKRSPFIRFLKVKAINEPQKYRRKLGDLTKNPLPFLHPPPGLVLPAGDPQRLINKSLPLRLPAVLIVPLFRLSSSSYAAHEMEHKADDNVDSGRAIFPFLPGPSRYFSSYFLARCNKTAVVYLISRLPFYSSSRNLQAFYAPPMKGLLSISYSTFYDKRLYIQFY